MKKRILTLAFAASLGLTGLIFTSCNDEEDLVRTRPTKDERVIDYSRFEDNDYTAERIFQMTADFSNRFNGDSVEDMSISDALIVMETFWNYGIVAKQNQQSGTPYEDKEFTFTVPISADNSLRGSDIRNNFRNCLHAIYDSMNHLCLNMGDMSVVNYNDASVTFKLKILGLQGKPYLYKDIDNNNIITTKIVKDFEDPISVPKEVTINPVNYTNIPSEIKEIVPYMLKKVPNLTVNIVTYYYETPDDNILSMLYVRDLTKEPYSALLTFHEMEHDAPTTFQEIQALEIEEKIIPSYLKYANRIPGKNLIRLVPLGNVDNWEEYLTTTETLGYLNEIYDGCIFNYPSQLCFLYKFGQYTFAQLIANTVPSVYDACIKYIDNIYLSQNILSWNL